MGPLSLLTQANRQVFPWNEDSQAGSDRVFIPIARTPSWRTKVISRAVVSQSQSCYFERTEGKRALLGTALVTEQDGIDEELIAEPPLPSAVEEFWTDSRRGLVVVSDRPRVNRIIRIIGMSPDAPVRISNRRWALAIVDDALDSYLEYRQTLERCGAQTSDVDELVSEVGPR